MKPSGAGRRRSRCSCATGTGGSATSDGGRPCSERGEGPREEVRFDLWLPDGGAVVQGIVVISGHGSGETLFVHPQLRATRAPVAPGRLQIRRQSDAARLLAEEPASRPLAELRRTTRPARAGARAAVPLRPLERHRLLGHLPGDRSPPRLGMGLDAARRHVSGLSARSRAGSRPGDLRRRRPFPRPARRRKRTSPWCR